MASKLHLQIPEPCHENWENMAPAERGRFCDSCQKKVIDFTNMSDREIAQFFKKPSTGNVCGRFLQDQLDRDIEIPKKRIPWVKYFFQFAIPAFLASTKATAQGGVIKKQQPVMEQQVKGDTITLSEMVVTGVGLKRQSFALDTTTPITPRNICSKPNNVHLLNIRLGGVAWTKSHSAATEINTNPSSKVNIIGVVTDQHNVPISGAVVIVTGSLNGAISDALGQFSIFTDSGRNNLSIKVSAVGFLQQEVGINATNKKVTVNLVPIGCNVVVVTAGLVVSKNRKTIPLIPHRFMDTAFKFFKVFPNPVHSGTDLTIEWNKAEAGYYTLQLFDQDGKMIHQREVWIDAEAKLLNLQLPSIASGVYFIRATAKQSRKSYTEKIIVQ